VNHFVYAIIATVIKPYYNYKNQRIMKNVLKHNKKLFFVMTIFICTLVVLLSSFDDHGVPPPNSRNLQQDPPIATKLTVQKLTEPLYTGENVMVTLTYKTGDISGGYVDISVGDIKTTFYDDGRTGGDKTAGDNIFSALAKEDLEQLDEQMQGFDNSLKAGGNMLDVFEGRLYSKVFKSGSLYDKSSFDQFKEIEISRDILRLPPDVSPVPGTLKTFQLNGDYGGGLPSRSSSFNNKSFMDFYNHLSYGPPPPPPPPIDKEKSLFITDLRVVRDPARTFNPCAGTFGSGNPNGAWTFASLIKGITNQAYTAITPRALVKSWINSWMVDLTINSETVRNRSLRMMTLVISRWIQKARHNAALVINAGNWQTEWDATHEDSLLRYAPFNLKAIVNRQDLRGNFGYGGGTNNSGETRFIWSLMQNTITAPPTCRDSVGAAPFDGFNVIFEYGNVQTNCNAVKNLGLQWANLSTFNLNTIPGLNGYLAALQAITDLVTVPNAAPSRTTNNKSAINQVRSKEIAITNAATVGTDKSPRWQFREFKINGATKLLEEVVLFNEPQNIFNGADGATLANSTILANWANSNSAAIIAQSTSGLVPLTVAPGATPFKAGKSNYPSTSPVQAPGFWNGTAGAGPGFITNDSTRFFFSNNTCSGCHAKQTETDFVMADYKGDNAAYNALSATPTILVIGSQFKFDISPFLTGRSAKFINPNFFFGDDSTGAAEDLTDNTLTGIFFANDAAGRVYPGTAVVRKWGFNDLQRRSQDLTNLITSSCSPIFVTALASVVFFQPVNMAH
jgi:hypothetical protein